MNERAPLVGPGAHYVAMGSSFASGLGVAPSAKAEPARCGRSAQNYAQQAARMLALELDDVTCSGAATRHILGPWGDTPAQVDALRADTALVTVTIGGNDIGYIGGLLNASCAYLAAQNGGEAKCRTSSAPTPASYEALEEQMRAIAAQVTARAPKAILVFVNYAAVLAPEGTCALTPLPPTQADASREIARRLEQITARAASQADARLIDAASLTAAHHACAQEPWMQGYKPNPDWRTHVPYHPTKAGMTAVAEALAAVLAP